MTTNNEDRPRPSERTNSVSDSSSPVLSAGPTQLNQGEQFLSEAASNVHDPSTADLNAVEVAAGEKAPKVDADRDTTMPSAPTNSSHAEPTKVFNMGLNQKSNKDLESRLSNFLGDYKSVKTTGSRSYDYEEKYDLDKEGEENGPDARVFKVYNDEAEKYDEDMVRGFRDTLDALLVFAALFSAVVTTFVVQTAQALQTDQAQVTNYLLLEQIQLLRANGNVTAISSISSSGLGPESSTYKQSDVWVNGLFFASLSLSLATALLSVLAKQWLQAYMNVTSGTARDVALIRHLRFSGLVRWKLHEIIGALPLILHTSLAVFSAGLVVFIRTLYPALSWIVIAISGLAFAFYLGSIILPAIYVGCPYRIPLLYKPSKYIINMPSAIYRAVIAVIQSIRRQIEIKSDSSTDLTDRESQAEVFQTWSLNDAEKFRVKESDLESMVSLAYECIFWLHDMSSNITVRRIAVWSTAGRFFKEENVPDSSLDTLKKVANNDVFNSFFAGEDIHSHDIASRAASNLFELAQDGYFCSPSQNDQIKQALQAAFDGRTNHVSLLLDLWKVKVNDTGYLGQFPLCSAACNNQLQTVMFLLDRGADVNLEGGLYGSALQAASSNGHVDIARLLLDKGADVNLRGGCYGSPLCAVSQYGHVHIAKLLLDKGADVNFIDGLYGSALHAAVVERRPNIEIFKLLLNNGADVNLKDIDGKTVLQVAESYAAYEPANRDRSEIVNILRAHIANINSRVPVERQSSVDEIA